MNSRTTANDEKGCDRFGAPFCDCMPCRYNRCQKEMKELGLHTHIGLCFRLEDGREFVSYQLLKNGKAIATFDMRGDSYEHLKAAGLYYGPASRWMDCIINQSREQQ